MIFRSFPFGIWRVNSQGRMPWGTLWDSTLKVIYPTNIHYFSVYMGLIVEGTIIPRVPPYQPIWKDLSQLGNLAQIGVNMKHMWTSIIKKLQRHTGIPVNPPTSSTNRTFFLTFSQNPISHRCECRERQRATWRPLQKLVETIPSSIPSLENQRRTKTMTLKSIGWLDKVTKTHSLQMEPFANMMHFTYIFQTRVEKRTQFVSNK